MDLSRFTKPNIQTVEVVAATGALPAAIMPDQFRHRGRRWVKRVILSAHDMADNANPPAANTGFLQQITGRWWRRMREEASGLLMPLTTFDNSHWRRTAPRALGAGPVQYLFGWDFDHSFIIPDNDVMYADICNRAVIAGNVGLNAGGLLLTVHGRGTRTGLPRILENPVAWPSTLAAPLIRLTATAATTQNAINQFGEDIEAKWLGVYSNGTTAVTVDTRIFAHLTMRVYFESKSGLSLCAPDVDNFVPVLAYGSHVNLDGYVAIWEPIGDPLITENSEALGWEFQHAAGQAERISVSIVSLLEE